MPLPILFFLNLIKNCDKLQHSITEKVIHWTKIVVKGVLLQIQQSQEKLLNVSNSSVFAKSNLLTSGVQ